MRVKILKFLRKLFVKNPERKLTYNIKDFNEAKKWAKTEDHPFDKNRNYWDFLKSYSKDSVEILDEVNKKNGKK